MREFPSSAVFPKCLPTAELGQIKARSWEVSQASHARTITAASQCVPEQEAGMVCRAGTWIQALCCRLGYWCQVGSSLLCRMPTLNQSFQSSIVGKALRVDHFAPWLLEGLHRGKHSVSGTASLSVGVMHMIPVRCRWICSAFPSSSSPLIFHSLVIVWNGLWHEIRADERTKWTLDSAVKVRDNCFLVFG